jgi:hypothetical protein
MAIIKKMSVTEWINVPDNPRQRDTVRHARAAKRSYLGKLEEPHKVVFAAIHNGEVKWKLDGHTRAYLWENGELEYPNGKLHVVCFDVDGEDDAKRLYLMFDNQSAAENAADRVSGACREHGICLASPLLRGYRFTLALQCASGPPKYARREYDYVGLWKEELQELDSWDLGKGIHTSLIALALVLIANGETKAKEFFAAYDKGHGIKDATGRDGVAALEQHASDRKAKDQNAGWDNIEDFFERAFTCFAAYRDGRRMQSGPRRSKRQTFQPRNKSITDLASKGK